MNSTTRTVADIRAAVDARDPQVNDDYRILLDEIDRLEEKQEQRRKRLAAADSDLQDIRGTLSPNGFPSRVPDGLLHGRVLPAVEWLLSELDRRTDERDQARGLAAALMEADAKRDDEAGITNEPADRRRRIYIDGKGTAWLDVAEDEAGTQYIAEIDADILFGEDTEDTVRERTGGLREIGRCW